MKLRSLLGLPQPMSPHARLLVELRRLYEAEPLPMGWFDPLPPADDEIVIEPLPVNSGN